MDPRRRSVLIPPERDSNPWTRGSVGFRFCSVSPQAGFEPLDPRRRSFCPVSPRAGFEPVSPRGAVGFRFCSVSPQAGFEPAAPRRRSVPFRSEAPLGPVSPRAGFEPLGPRRSSVPFHPERDSNPRPRVSVLSRFAPSGIRTLGREAPFCPVSPGVGFEPVSPRGAVGSRFARSGIRTLGPEAPLDPVSPHTGFEPSALRRRWVPFRSEAPLDPVSPGPGFEPCPRGSVGSRFARSGIRTLVPESPFCPVSPGAGFEPSSPPRRAPPRPALRRHKMAALRGTRVRARGRPRP